MSGRADRLLRGERAAVAAYERALGDLDDDVDGRETIERLVADHREAVAVLEGHLGHGDDGEGAGAWGAFAVAVERAASWIGDTAALEALKEGEVHGLSEYRTLADHDDPSPALHRDVAEILLPRQREHVEALDRLIDARRAAPD